tara:strand:- start:1603 stop:1920 length:318 start_codon:yes stop_codon:yes gene_type:complete
MKDNDTIKHWTITTTLERTFTGTEKEAEQLRKEEHDWYDSMVDGGDFCAYVVGSRIECDGVPTPLSDADHMPSCNIQIDHVLRCNCGHADNLAQYGDHPLATAGD